MSLSPLRDHLLDQFLALTLDVQARLKGHRDALIATGWTEAEAWALCQRIEERILSPGMDLAERAARMDHELRKAVRDGPQR